MTLTIPNLSLVALVGCSGSGKSTFARAHFAPHEVLSSDFCRGLVSNDENALDATGDAFDVLYYIAAKRLARGLLTVVDATNVQEEARAAVVKLAREHDVLPVAIVLNVPEKLCQERNKTRPDRDFGPHVIRKQNISLRRSLRRLQREGFRHVHVLNTPEEIAAASIVREPLWNDRRHERGPFDLIGDVHGCFDELLALLDKLGYMPQPGGAYAHPAGRKLVFLGDLVDRGPRIPDVVRLVMECVKAGSALCVPGNHDIKFMRAAFGKNVQVTHGLADSLEQFKAHEQDHRGFSNAAAQFIDSLVSHYLLDGGALVVAHAGMKEAYQGRGSRRVREFALYGETTGETDEFGLPVRHNWAAEYRGGAHVVYGHTPVPHAEWLNRTMNIDTGCVFGGALTALRWPERATVSVSALRTYAEPVRPLAGALPLGFSAQQMNDDLLDVSDVIGKRIVNTRLMSNLTIREENAAAALEVMSRFAANPKWLIHLPPTMAPTETSRTTALLEHPAEAFDYFRTAGVGKVVCQEKHMGSRAIAIVCRDEAAAARRFGVEGESGIIYTRTGRRFFDDPSMEGALLGHLRAACGAAGFWEEFSSDWFCFDCELMPWSAKAQELLKGQYAAVGAAASAGLSAAVDALSIAAARDAAPAGADALLQAHRARAAAAAKYVAAYRHYCWPVNSVADLKLAPFHLLASEGKVHVDKNHLWHMSTLRRLAPGGAPLIATPHLEVDVTDPSSIAAAIEWWTSLTSTGGEGMVVKPLDFIVRGGKGLVQPAVKCRGPEYLRIIYGPEYDAPENLPRLRSRRIGPKRALALREFSLGIEALERFIRREPLRRVHECVFAVLALESEPVDARL